jgi:hypothetical protein
VVLAEANGVLGANLRSLLLRCRRAVIFGSVYETENEACFIERRAALHMSWDWELLGRLPGVTRWPAVSKVSGCRGPIVEFMVMLINHPLAYGPSFRRVGACRRWSYRVVQQGSNWVIE